ncbi:DUF3857 domain-containing protein [Verminephrobacter aporrectodeae subsp. tuberculatae]|nr:DUF3857 domain-containing protein [Verminephrobacter aporrectodeae subsp. tuberculatae]
MIPMPNHTFSQSLRVLTSCFMGLSSLFICTEQSSAQGFNQAAHFTVLKYEQRIFIRADLTFDWELVIERQALSNEGALVIGKYSQVFNAGLEDVQLQEAYTLKADGRSIAVRSDGVQRQKGMAAAGVGFSWPEGEILQITFPDVQAGDRMRLVLKGRNFKTPLPGWQAVRESISHVVNFEHIYIRVEAPQELDLQVGAHQLALESFQSGKNQVWEIKGSSKASMLDGGALNIEQTRPYWMFSSMKHWEQFGQTFAQAFAGRLVDNSRITALAAQITGDEKEAAAKARKLHTWVRQNIRYVAVYLGVGGWVPHDLDWILENRYGDCKDQSLLLIALLRAAGIAAHPVLLRSQADHDLPDLPGPWFDHCIVYIPELDLFTDTTATQIALGALPYADSDKPALLARLQAPSELLRTPSFKAQDNRALVQSNWQIFKDGSARVQLNIEAWGQMASWLQERLRQIPENMREATLARWLNESGVRGTGKMQFSPLQTDRQWQDLRITADVRDLLPDPEAGAIPANPTVGSVGVYILSNLGNVSPDKRQHALACTPHAIREEFTLRFADDFHILRAPGSMKISTPEGIRFEQMLETKGQQITGWRDYAQDRATHTCSPQEHAARQPALSKIWRHLRSSVLFTRN